MRGTDVAKLPGTLSPDGLGSNALRPYPFQCLALSPGGTRVIWEIGTTAWGVAKIK
jgi:hypothetical protein